MKVVIAGSRRLPPGEAPRLLIRFLAAVPDDVVILLRRGVMTEPGYFELDVAALCDFLGLNYEWIRPHPNEGRGGVFLRDIEMIDKAHLVLLFFEPEEAGAGRSGTAHLLEKALDADRPVYAYTVNGKDVKRVGEYDPDNQFTDMVPAA